MRPAHDGGVVKGPHVYVKRKDGSSGYEPAEIPVVMAELPTAADLDAIAAEDKAKEATTKKAEKSWGNTKAAKS